MRSKFVAKGMTNPQGDVIEPGDKVLVVTVSSHTVGTYKGIYVGYRQDDRGHTTSYTVRYYPGHRFDKIGMKTVHYKNYKGEDKSYTVADLKKVEDPDYYKTCTSFNGLIYKVA